MIICKTEDEKSKVFKDIQEKGFTWYAPMNLSPDRLWPGTDNPQVEDYCPNCRWLSDRTFNSTKVIDGWHWMLNHCLSCGVVWFEYEMV